MELSQAHPTCQPTAAAPRRPLLLLFYWMAFLSGVAALIYEITWARMLGLTFGNTTLSAAAVIAGFMGGMGLGAWLYHLVYDRVSHPLLIYSGLEFGIAVTTALLTRTFYHLPDVFAQISSAVPPGPWLAVIRFAWVFVLLVIPAALMGATFPALCTAVIRTVRGVDRHMGMIYGINTIGAAAGALFAGLILIERLGLTGTVTAANAINLAVAVVALSLLSTSLGRGDPRTTPPSESAIPTLLPRRLTGVVLFVSGFATLSYEILWFRALRFLVGNSTYALTIVLVIFLIGLGLGSLLLERVARRQRPERDLALIQCTTAVLALLAMTCVWLTVALPSVHEQVNIFSKTVRNHPWWWRLIVDGTLATVTMLPPTLFMGLSFPVASRLFLGDVRKLGTRVGGAYLLANLGSILGALLAATLMLPLFSTIGGTKLVAVINLGLGLAVLLWIRKRAANWAPLATTAVVLVAVMVFVLPGSLSRLGEKSRQVGGVVIFSRDGDLATVEVQGDPDDPTKRIMTVDGCPIGWSRGFRTEVAYKKQLLLAHLPMVLDTRIRNTLNIGLGSASTLATLATYPEVRTLDCVEISRAVVQAAELFPESAVFDDPRVTLIVEDAVHFLLRTGPMYDLIISDGKQDPFYSGNATLLCREFYQYAADRLINEGVFIQWLPMATLHTDVQANLRTCCEVFPCVEVFCFPPASIIVLGAKQPIFGRPQLTRERFMRLPIRLDLTPFLIDHPSAMLAAWCAGKPQLEQVLDDGPVSTWDHLLLDFSAFKAPSQRWSHAQIENLTLLLRAEDIPRPGAELFALREPAYCKSAALLRRAHRQSFAGNLALARDLAQEAVRANPGDRAADAFLKRLLPSSPRSHGEQP